jgi:hypothetical protein
MLLVNPQRSQAESGTDAVFPSGRFSETRFSVGLPRRLEANWGSFWFVTREQPIVDQFELTTTLRHTQLVCLRGV